MTIKVLALVGGVLMWVTLTIGTTESKPIKMPRGQRAHVRK